MKKLSTTTKIVIYHNQKSLPPGRGRLLHIIIIGSITLSSIQVHGTKAAPYIRHRISGSPP